MKRRQGLPAKWRGLLIKSFKEKIINGPNLYYNWRPHSIDFAWKVTSSGRFVVYDKENKDYIWSGAHHSILDGLRRKIQRLRDCGNFILPWRESPFYGLNHHGDDKELRDELTKLRAAKFPKELIEMGIAPKEWRK